MAIHAAVECDLSALIHCRYCLRCSCCTLQHLKQLGVASPFDRSRADFSKLSPEPLFITDVLQSVSNCSGVLGGLSCTAYVALGAFTSCNCVSMDLVSISRADSRACSRSQRQLSKGLVAEVVCWLSGWDDPSNGGRIATQSAHAHLAPTRHAVLNNSRLPSCK